MPPTIAIPPLPTISWEIFLASFNEYTLTTSDYHATLFYSTLFYLLYFFICYGLFFNEKKRLAWCISLFNSFTTTLISIIYIIVKTYTGTGILNSSSTLDAVHGNDNISAITCTIFAVVNILDLTLGLIFYRSSLGIMTTYIHHTLYLWLMYLLITGNGLFLTTPTPFSMAFIWCLVEELPTFLLALGSIFPACRSDILFGASFFILRLVYHVYLFLLMMRMGAYRVMLVLYGITFIMHVEWFRTWFTKYGINYFRSSESKKKK